MGIGGRFHRSLALTRQSWALLSRNASLIVLPIISGIVLLIVIGSFVLPIILSEELRNLLDGDSPDTEYLDYALGFLFYLAAFTVTTFFNAALMFCILTRLRGGRCSVGDGLGMALRRFPQIFAWALVSATIGLVLNILRDRAGGAGQIIAGLAGLAWSIATYFVVPILVVEGVWPFEALRRSAGTLRRAWGESLMANISLNLIAVAITLVLAGIVALAFAVLPQEAAIGVLAVAIALFTVAVLILSTLTTILRATIYDYAVNGSVPEEFERSSLENAFHPKRAPA